MLLKELGQNAGDSAGEIDTVVVGLDVTAFVLTV